VSRHDCSRVGLLSQAPKLIDSAAATRSSHTATGTKSRVTAGEGGVVKEALAGLRDHATRDETAAACAPQLLKGARAKMRRKSPRASGTPAGRINGLPYSADGVVVQRVFHGYMDRLSGSSPPT
jgi:hypothetical protein